MIQEFRRPPAGHQQQAKNLSRINSERRGNRNVAGQRRRAVDVAVADLQHPRRDAVEVRLQEGETNAGRGGSEHDVIGRRDRPSTTVPAAPAVNALIVPVPSVMKSARFTMSPAPAGEAEVLSIVEKFENVPPLPPAIRVIFPPWEETGSRTLRLSNPTVGTPVAATVRVPPTVATPASGFAAGPVMVPADGFRSHQKPPRLSEMPGPQSPRRPHRYGIGSCSPRHHKAGHGGDPIGLTERNRSAGESTQREWWWCRRRYRDKCGDRRPLVWLIPPPVTSSRSGTFVVSTIIGEAILMSPASDGVPSMLR